MMISDKETMQKIDYRNGRNKNGRAILALGVFMCFIKMNRIRVLFSLISRMTAVVVYSREHKHTKYFSKWLLG